MQEGSLFPTSSAAFIVCRFFDDGHLTDEWIKKMWHIYNGILLSHKKNEIELFVVRWMDLESVIQSVVSQKEKTNTVC